MLEKRTLIRLAIVDDSEFLRAGLRTSLKPEEGLEVVGEFAHNERAVSSLERLKPDVVLVGMRDPSEVKSIAICRQIQRASPETRVLMLSPTSGEAETLASILAGASGCVSVDVSSSEIARAVHLAVSGRTYFESVVSDSLLSRLESLAREEESRAGLEILSHRELTILRLVAEGYSNLGIADELNIASSTVRNHLTRMRSKLGLDTRTKLVRFAYEQGVVDVFVVTTTPSED